MSYEIETNLQINKWFHAICAGVKKEIFDACRHMENLHWICEDCNPVASICDCQRHYEKT